MEKQNLSEIEIEDSLRAFAVSLSRYACKDPSILLEVAKVTKNQDQAHAWEELYRDLQDPDVLSTFVTKTKKLTQSHDWSNIERTYRTWGMWGWITFDSMGKFRIWDNCPSTQIEADKQVLKNFKKCDLLECIDKIKAYTNEDKVFEEAYACFDNKYYHACASLLISLIDGKLISSRANCVLNNRKTGAIAGSRVITNISKDETYGEPGLFHLELVNYTAFIDMLFERADGFQTEPRNINRNYLHHGMSKRKVLRKDCIKLFLAYEKTLEYARKPQE